MTEQNFWDDRTTPDAKGLTESEQEMVDRLKEKLKEFPLPVLMAAFFLMSPCPTCPSCGEYPSRMFGTHQVLCGTETCTTIFWDPSQTKEQNIVQTQYIRLPDNGHEH